VTATVYVMCRETEEIDGGRRRRRKINKWIKAIYHNYRTIVPRPRSVLSFQPNPLTVEGTVIVYYIQTHTLRVPICHYGIIFIVCSRLSRERGFLKHYYFVLFSSTTRYSPRRRYDRGNLLSSWTAGIRCIIYSIHL